MCRMTDTIKQLAQLLINNNQKLAMAESCTGGLIAKLCTDLAGSSIWFDRGFVTYSNEAKTDMLSVPKQMIDTQGAVSQQVAEQMAQGAIQNSQAEWSVAVTGIAGPTGGSEEKPVGLVWFAWSNKSGTTSEKHIFKGDRDQVRQQTAQHALQKLVELLSK